MTKDVSLTVKVSDEQFQKFAKNFAALADKMKNLSTQFKALAATIDDTTKSSRSLVSTMQSVWTNTQQIHGVTQKISQHIFKWGTLVSAVGALLGGGALFGMDKIANRLIEQRRRLLGLGGADYGKTQAVETFGKGLLDDPKEALSNVAKSKTDVQSEAYRALRALGISGEDIAKKKPEELLDMALDRASKRLMKERPELRLPVARSLGLGGLGLSDQDLVRLGDPKHAKELLEDFRKRVKAERGTLTDDDLKAWDKFWASINNFSLTMKTEWQKALTPLAPALTKVTDEFTKLVTALLESQKLAWGIEKLAKGIEGIADYMEKTDAKKAFQDFINMILNLLRLSPVGLVQKGAGYVWNAAKGAYDYAAGGGSTTPPVAGAGSAPTAQSPSTSSTPTPSPSPSPSPTTPSPSPTARAAPSSFSTPQEKAPFLNRGGMPGMSATSKALPGGFEPGPSAPNFFNQNSSGGGSSTGMSKPLPIPGLPASLGFGQRFSSAVGRMAPEAGAGISKLSSMFASAGGGGPGGKQAQGSTQGPLDANNWQSNRTASLVIRGVPSANLFVSAVGMVG